MTIFNQNLNYTILKRFINLFLFVILLLFNSCSEVSNEIDKKINELKSKTNSLDSLVNNELNKVLSLDSLINMETEKVKKLDSLINRSTSKVDSIIQTKLPVERK